MQAEARRLARIEGSLDSALNAAVQSGQIERLPLDFYAKAGSDGAEAPKTDS